LGKDRASRPAKTIRSADGAQARGLSRRDARRPTIFFKIAADKDLALIRAQHLKKGRLEKTEASENPGPFEILLAANPSDSTGWKSPTPVRPPPSLVPASIVRKKDKTVPRVFVGIRFAAL
jgi:hypothetical protein